MIPAGTQKPQSVRAVIRKVVAGGEGVISCLGKRNDWPLTRVSKITTTSIRKENNICRQIHTYIHTYIRIERKIDD